MITSLLNKTSFVLNELIIEKSILNPQDSPEPFGIITIKSVSHDPSVDHKPLVIIRLTNKKSFDTFHEILTGHLLSGDNAPFEIFSESFEDGEDMYLPMVGRVQRSPIDKDIIIEDGFLTIDKKRCSDFRFIDNAGIIWNHSDLSGYLKSL